ncbi:hypothetical protein AA313_de0208426 [Arthrobotrys entomopaga]|nr:hypothetical protein AA313_de0208426 [Arthrobotrys entomopaga]
MSSFLGKRWDDVGNKWASEKQFAVSNLYFSREWCPSTRPTRPINNCDSTSSGPKPPRLCRLQGSFFRLVQSSFERFNRQFQCGRTDCRSRSLCDLTNALRRKAVSIFCETSAVSWKLNGDLINSASKSYDAIHAHL